MCDSGQTVTVSRDQFKRSNRVILALIVLLAASLSANLHFTLQIIAIRKGIQQAMLRYDHQK